MNYDISLTRLAVRDSENTAAIERYSEVRALVLGKDDGDDRSDEMDDSNRVR